MKELLNVQYLPYFQFLNYCSKHPSQESVSSISTKLNIDRRILLKTIKQLQIDISKNNWIDVLTLNLNDSKLTVICGPLFSLDLFYSHYMSISFCVELILFLFQHQKATIDELLDYFYMSQSTFYRRIVPLKKVLAQFNLELSFISKQQIIHGEEKQIRHFFFTLFWEIFNTVPPAFICLSKDDKKLLSTFNAKHNLPISLAQILNIQLTIGNIRMKQGFILTEFPTFFLPLLYISRIDFHKEFILFFKKRNLSPEQADTEINSLYFLLVTANIYPSIVEKDLDIQVIDWSSSLIIYSQKWVTYYKSFFGHSLSNEDYFYLLLNLYLIQLKNQFLTGNYFSFGISTVEELLPDNPHTLAQINQFFDFLNQKEPEFHVSPFQRVTYARLIRRIVSKSKPALQILICSKIGKEEIDWMNQFVKKISPIPLVIYSIWKPDLDLIISDYSLQKSLIPEDLSHYFLCPSFSGFDDWALLLKRLEELYYTKITISKD
ncbi:helix-turn-helix domain-containing protein [Carnobacterium maltaromaticum]|uniref:helix-turn-helix domain-containing protein n=1 Tax=Carnobacterium maltaromaticum TaxID=2751 RepID=UPI00191BCAA2|nr:helix-turn-helix domain-containing protein [Carnobacterium maltaromaticum]CAD5901658.1 conserved hypothetical protein [Carnobacterium maltaromaticum]